MPSCHEATRPLLLHLWRSDQIAYRTSVNLMVKVLDFVQFGGSSMQRLGGQHLSIGERAACTGVALPPVELLTRRQPAILSSLNDLRQVEPDACADAQKDGVLG